MGTAARMLPFVNAWVEPTLELRAGASYNKQEIKNIYKFYNGLHEMKAKKPSFPRFCLLPQAHTQSTALYYTSGACLRNERTLIMTGGGNSLANFCPM